MSVSSCLWCLLFPILNIVQMNELHLSNPIFLLITYCQLIFL